MNYEDYSSGRVLYNYGNTTGFPVRLASEIFQRGLKLLEKSEGIDIYDPFCGGGYLLTTIGLVHRNSIRNIFASDSDGEVLEICEKNLSLLTLSGIEKRISQIKTLLNEYDKESHKQALASAYKIKERIISSKRIGINISKINAFEVNTNGLSDEIDLIISDLPYGNLVSLENEGNDIEDLLSIFNPILKQNGVVILVTNSKIRFNTDSYKRIMSSKHGKRFIYIFQKI